MKNLIYIVVFLFSSSIWGQSLKSLLKKHNTESVAYIDVNTLKSNPNFIVLDAREKKEFMVSHLKNAIHVGYDYFDLKTTCAGLTDKNATIVVYCSIGIRSEDIAEHLQNAGYKNVFNLYGGIFEWKNKGNSVVDSLKVTTEKVHTYSKKWSKWLKRGTKVYE